MASTRNINTASDYCLQQRANMLANNYNYFANSSYGSPSTIAIPEVGYTPSHMSYDAFSKNGIEIESALFGINSTNLVDPRLPTRPILNNVQVRPFFERTPLIMPMPHITNPDERPFPV